MYNILSGLKSPGIEEELIGYNAMMASNRPGHGIIQ